ncbi:MAG: hypothetical protein QX196_08115 [Methylococcaceae bacterium]
MNHHFWKGKGNTVLMYSATNLKRDSLLFQQVRETATTLTLYGFTVIVHSQKCPDLVGSHVFKPFRLARYIRGVTQN